MITLPTKRPKRPPKQSLKLGVGTREKVWGEGSNRRIEGEGEKEKVKSAAATMIDRLGGFRREVRRWMEKENTGDDREAGLGESVAMVSIIILLQSAGRTGDGRTF